MTEPAIKNVNEFIAGDGIRLQRYRKQLIISRDAEPYGPDDTINVLGINLTGSLNTTDFITKGPWVDVRSFMDGVAGRPTYATWYANQATTILDSVIQATVNYAAATTVGAYQNRAEVLFPPGIFLVSQNGVLTPTNTTSVRAGIHFRGCGRDTSILRFSSLSSPSYFYDNVATPRTQMCSFSDLGFQGLDPALYSSYTDIPMNANGFRLWATSVTGSHEQLFHFSRCHFFGLNVVLTTAGDNTTSENHFSQCIMNEIYTVASINNLQSFDHEYYGCYLNDIYGDAFIIGTNGGGAIKMFGGTVIMQPGVAATYFINATTSPSVEDPMIFNGVKFEFLGNTTNLVQANANIRCNVTFENCRLYDTSAIEKPAWVTIWAQSSIWFKGCAFFELNGDYIRFILAGASSGYGINGEIIFDSCALTKDWSDKCSVTSGGLISARNCYGTNIGAVVGEPNHWAHDFDLHWDDTAGQYIGWAGPVQKTDSGNPSHPQWVLKTAQIKTPRENWPTGGGWPDMTLKLPKNAIIKNIHLRKPAGGADTISTIFRIGRDDKSGTDHLVSDTQQMKDAHTGDVSNYFYHVGDTANERTIRLYTDESPTGVIYGGLCIVEYY